ncbi:MAG: hypothetical protein ACI4QN_04970, partial [Candidatus Coproplasma sp.]
MKNKHDNDKRSYILTKETLGVTIMMFCALVFVILLSYDVIFMGFGKAICTFMYGTFGYGCYLVIAALAYLGEWLAFGKSIKVRPRVAICLAVTVFCVFLLFQAVTTRNFAMENYGNYLSQCYLNAANGYSGYCFGGVISGLIVYPVAKIMTFVGAYVIFSLLTVLFAVMSFIVIRNAYLTNIIENVGKQNHKVEKQQAERQPQAQQQERVVTDDKLYSVNENHEIVSNVGVQTQSATEQAGQSEDDDKYSRKNLGRQILFENGEFAAESYRRNMIYNESSYFNHPVHNDSDYLQSFSNGKNNSSSQTQTQQSSYTEGYSNDVEKSNLNGGAPSYVYGDTPVSDLGNANVNNGETTYNSYTVDRTAEPLNYDSELVDEQSDDITVENERLSNDDLPDNNDNSYTGEEPYVQSSRGNDYTDVQNEQPIAQQPRQSVQSSRQDVSNKYDSADDKPEEQASERGRSINLFDIFNSSNTNLSNNSGTIEPDVSVLSDPSRNRSREQLFDDTEGEEGTFFGEETPLSNRGSEDDMPVGGDRVRTVEFGDNGKSNFERTSAPVPKPVEAKREEEKPAEP